MSMNTVSENNTEVNNTGLGWTAAWGRGRKSEVPQPPDTDRGVDSPHLQSCVFSADWWRFTVWSDFDGVLPLLRLLGLADGLVELGHGGLGFKKVMSGLHGFQLYCDPVGVGQNYVSLSLPSKVLQFVGLDKLAAAASWLCEQGLNGLRWNTTRFDLAFDTQGFTVQQFADAYRAGLVATRSRSWQEITGAGGSHTFYVGSRESEALLRVYHKVDGHSFGSDAFTRVELELKGDRAALAFLEVVAAPMDQWAGMAAGLLSGFVQVSSGWWSDFLGAARSSWLRLRRNVPTVDRAAAWIEKQVLPSLALVVGAVSGGDVDHMAALLQRMVNDGRERFTEKHWGMLDRYSPDTSPVFAVYSL